MIFLLAGGAFVYTMGHNAAPASTDGADAKPPAAWEQVATTGGTWIARELHKQTAWAAESPSTAQPAAIDIQPTFTIAVR